MKKPNKDTIIEIIGAIILLALIGGIVSCNTVGCNMGCREEGPTIYDSNHALSH